MTKSPVLNKEEEKELLKALNKYEKVERTASLSWDGTNILLRLPREIADYLNINQKNRSEKLMKFIIEETNDGVKKSFEIIV